MRADRAAPYRRLNPEDADHVRTQFRQGRTDHRRPPTGRLHRRRDEAGIGLADRHRAREIRLPPRRPASADLGRRAGHRCPARRPDPLRLGARHREGQADRPLARWRFGDPRAGRPAGTFRRAAGDHPPDLRRSAWASEGSEDRCRRTRRRFPRHGFPAQVGPRGHAMDAEGSLRDHAPLHADGRRPRTGHDDADLHGAGQSRFRRRSRHGAQVPYLARVAAGGHGAVRRFSVHRRQAERLSQLSLAYLDGHRCRSHRHARFRFRGRLRLRALCRLSARCADVFQLPQRRVSRPRRTVLPQVHARPTGRPARRHADDDRLGRSHDHGLSGGAPEEVSGDARRGWRALESPVRLAGILGRPALRRDVARCGLGPGQGFQSRGTQCPAR